MKWIVWLFATLYVLAIALFAISAFGWFGQERDALGAVFLLPLGLPWYLLADRIGMASPAVVIAAPLVNLAILYSLWKWRSNAAAKRGNS